MGGVLSEDWADLARVDLRGVDVVVGSEEEVVSVGVAVGTAANA